MSSICIKGKFYYMVLYSFLKCFFFINHIDHFNEALHGVSTLSITRYLFNVGTKTFQYLLPLSWGWTLQKFLAEVISILVSHQIMQVSKTLFNSESYEVWRSSRKHFLKILRAMLLFSHLNYLTFEFLNLLINFLLAIVMLGTWNWASVTSTTLDWANTHFVWLFRDTWAVTDFPAFLCGDFFWILLSNL